MSKNNLWRQIVWSSYDLEFYRRVRSRPWFESFRYLLAFGLLLAVLFAALFAPAAFSFPGRAVGFLEKLPAESYIAVKSGRIETDLPQPAEWGSGNYRIVIDTSIEGGEWRETLPSGAMIVGRDAIFIDQLGDQRVLPASDLGELSLTRAAALDWWKKYGPGFGIAATLALFVAYLFILVLANVFLALLGAVMAFAIGRALRLQPDFGSWFAAGLHAITLPVLASVLFGLLGLDAPAIRTVIFFMFIAAVVIDERNNPLPAVASGSEKK
ncbi:MAG: DUF1189 family protein [Patescibacteria group bacterium]